MVNVQNIRISGLLLVGGLLLWACTSTEPGDGGAAGAAGSSSGAGGTTTTGGTPGTGGGVSGTSGATTGGTPGTGGNPVGGSPATGGTPPVGGSAGVSTGGVAGTPPAGGSDSGGAPTGGMGGSTSGTAGAGGTVSGIAVQLNVPRQTIQGFGINTALMPAEKNVPYDELFTTNGANAIGLSILRVGMTPTGTLTGKGVAEAKQRGAKVIGSTWSPPANCKSNMSTQNGGSLLPSCYDSWSTTIANFAQAQGLYAMSIANESDFASCPGVPVCTTAYDTTTFTARQMVDWVKVAGPKLKALNPPVKVIAPEASEWIHVWSNASATGSLVASHPNSSDPLMCGCFSNTINETGCAQTCLDGNGYNYGHRLWADQTAWMAFDILGVHQYDSQIAYAWPMDVNNGVRNKEVWQTEMSGVRHWPEEGPSTDINNGVVVARWIHSAMTVGEASAWFYWWYEAYYENDNEGLALVQGSTTRAKRYFTMGNFSKFVRPGYVAVPVAGGDTANVLLSAYKSADNATTVIVAINQGNAMETPSIGFSGGTAPTMCTPHLTSAMVNLTAQTAVAVTGGRLNASLASKTVTTYVCM
jgi:glucuronoarabinoxylan endo-1,4-beta-xylanase